MEFLKNLFLRKPFVPTPTQVVPGIEPIVVQAIEILFPQPKQQQIVFNDLLEYGRTAETRKILALLNIIDGDMNAYHDYINYLSTDASDYYILGDTGFFNMRDAEKWVQSLTTLRDGKGKKCSNCATVVKIEAKVCKNCGEKFPNV